MIEIITTSGVSLDIDPSYEFEIEMENPMLDDTHIPIAYSTSIAFLPTAKNKSVFGYLAAMYREPDVKQLMVSIHAGGIPLFWGRLEYESMEDGNLNYTFAGRDLEDEWDENIHTLEHLSKLDFSISSIFSGELSSTLRKIMSGEMTTDFELPMIVSSENITDVEYKTNDLGKESVELAVKYHNYFWSPLATMTSPAVKVSAILSKAFKNVSISENLKTAYESLAILALYRKKAVSASGLQQGSGTKHMLDIASMLPECTVFDLVSNLAKMFCASVFRDGEKFRLLSNKEVLLDNNVIDWSDKVSDEFSLSVEPSSSYIFGFANDSEENTYTADKENYVSTNDAGSIYECLTINEILNKIRFSKDYVAVKYLATGDMYSGKAMQITTQAGSSFTLPYADMLLHKMEKFSSDEEQESSFDNSVELKCVRCIPISCTNPFLGTNVSSYHMCPIVKFPASEDNRPTEIWIGAMLNGHLIDKGYAFVRQTESSERENALDASNPNISLNPSVLYRRFHRQFAEFLSLKKRVIATQVFLSMQEISELRLYQKISICNQSFLIKKITFNFSADREGVDTQVELIDCPLKFDTPGFSFTDPISGATVDGCNAIRLHYWGEDTDTRQCQLVADYPVKSDIYANFYRGGQLFPIKIMAGDTRSGVIDGDGTISAIGPTEDAHYRYLWSGRKYISE